MEQEHLPQLGLFFRQIHVPSDVPYSNFQAPDNGFYGSVAVTVNAEHGERSGNVDLPVSL